MFVCSHADACMPKLAASAMVSSNSMTVQKMLLRLCIDISKGSTGARILAWLQ